MSGNSNSEGASGFARPLQLNGYTAEWDAEVGVWVLTCDADPERVVRGRNQTELDAEHAELIAGDIADLRAYIDYASANAYTPPSRGWVPPHRT